MNIANQTNISEKTQHFLTLENRANLKLTGVRKTLNYDEYSVLLDTDYGNLLIGGSNIIVNEISSTTGDVSIQGNIEYMQYQAKKQTGNGAGGFLKRLVR